MIERRTDDNAKDHPGEQVPGVAVEVGPHGFEKLGQPARQILARGAQSCLRVAGQMPRLAFNQYPDVPARHGQLGKVQQRLFGVGERHAAHDCRERLKTVEHEFLQQLLLAGEMPV